MSEVSINFLPEIRAAKAAKGSLLAEAARLAGIPLNMQCGGKGRCGKCTVVFTEGAPEPSPLEIELLGEERTAAGERLGCRARVHEDATICIPEKSRLWHIPAAKEQSRQATRVELHPAVKRTAVKLVPPSTIDPAPDIDRLLAALPEGTTAPDISLLRKLPAIIRKKDFHVTALVRNGVLLDVFPGAVRRPILGAAVDVGTTTIGVRIFDLETGEETGNALAPNPQAAFGADVASRSAYIAEHKDGLSKLSKLITAEVDRLIRGAAAAGGASPDAVVETVLVGNPTMVQIFLGIDPGPISVSPFTPATADLVECSARKAGLGTHRRGSFTALPAVAGYVGADAVAALLSATSLGDTPLPALLIDLGTNAEIMLLTGNGALACAAAAGPALEGAQLSCGMGAYPGAVDSVSACCKEVKFTTIGETSPLGLCGTGALDLLTGLLELGIIEPSGRFADAASWPEALQSKFYRDEKKRPAFLISRAANGAPLGLTQADVRHLQLARAAILAGVNVLLETAGITVEQLGGVLLAGALGTFMKASTALRAGLVPAVPEDKIRFIGNAALEGAHRALLDSHERTRALELARSTKYIELSGDMRFAKEFERCMPFSAQD